MQNGVLNFLILAFDMSRTPDRSRAAKDTCQVVCLSYFFIVLRQET